MSKDISFNQFKEMIAGHFGVDGNELVRETSLIDDLGIDSLSLVNFIIKLEKRYNVKIDIDKVWILKNIGEAYDLFMQKLKALHPPQKDSFLRSIT